MKQWIAAALVLGLAVIYSGPVLGEEGAVLSTPAFEPGGKIAVLYTCDGRDVSPPLAWKGLPKGTKTLALIVDDPDAPGGTWVHWVMYNIPASSTGLSEGVPRKGDLPDGSRQGENSWRRLGYGGPCPPSGSHRYYFTLYALDTVLDQPAGLSKKGLLRAMEGHILGQARLMGRFR